MAVNAQEITDRYAIYNGDCVEVLGSLPQSSIHLSVYSPPFADLFSYSSSDRDLSNCQDYAQFLKHYEFVVKEVSRVTMPGRISAVHCMDIPIPGQKEGYRDFPGDIVTLHKRNGFHFHGRIGIWKEPWRIALRTRLRGLMHRQLVEDSTVCTVANGDQLLLFRRHGQNKVPIPHPEGLSEYSGDRGIPAELLKYKGERQQQKNRLSQWIWRQYASCFWDDIRVDRVLPYREAREPDDEKHICPLQLDVIERTLVLWSNEGERVLTPFMGIGSEVYAAVAHGRLGIGAELKPSYFRQARKNVVAALTAGDQSTLEFQHEEPAADPAEEESVGVGSEGAS